MTNCTTATDKARTFWTLKEWSSYFEDVTVKKPPMTSEEIAAAVLWLTDHEYPIPADCPKRPEVSPLDGGCPAFKPMCLIYPVCQMARGMCREAMGMAKCPTCHKTFNPDNLRDPLSKKEFRISGMCQACQDSVFSSAAGKDPCEGCKDKGTKLCKEKCPI